MTGEWTMKHFDIYRKNNTDSRWGGGCICRRRFVYCGRSRSENFPRRRGSCLLCGLLFLTDYLHCRYNDDLLEKITLLVEALVEQDAGCFFGSRRHADCTACAPASETPQYFNGTESDAGAGKRADKNFNL